MRDPLDSLSALAAQARCEPVPTVRVADRVVARICAHAQRADRVLPVMVAAAAALAAAMSAQLVAIVRALNNPLAAFFHLSATLVP